MSGQGAQFAFKGGQSPIHHVIYILKENRTYDQIFGDIKEGNGDPSLVMYGEPITPNEHALARQFGVLDNFYDSGEVSGNGHPWSTSATNTDYGERTWPIGYRGLERDYDSEGTIGDSTSAGRRDTRRERAGHRLSVGQSGARHGKTYRHYGEYVADHLVHERRTRDGGRNARCSLREMRCPGDHAGW